MSLNTKGIGPQLKLKLSKKGIKTKKQLLKHIDELPIITQVHLKYKVKDSLTRKIVEELEPKLTGVPTKVVISGSYSRGKKNPGDIDLIFEEIKSYNINDYLEYLNKTFDHIVIFAKGTDKVSLLIKLGKEYVKCDIFITNKKEYYATLLYVTGSQKFNIIMRGVAKKHGYVLNQKGLFYDGKQHNFNSEKKYFEAIGMKYKSPEEREI